MSRCLLLALCGGMLFTGCTKPAAPRAAAGAAAEGKKFLLAEEPAGAIGVKQAKTDSKDADEVTLVGRIGGAEDPWVKGQAAFTIVDTALKPCNEQDDDDCPKPWDYCCDTDALPANKALIKLVDASGKTIATDARELLGVKELQTIVVHGKAKRDEANNLTVLAESLFVRK